LKSYHTIRLILGDQLNSKHSWFDQVDAGVLYVLMEVRSETDYVKHHIQKVVAFFMAMRAFAEERRLEGHDVHYINLDDPDNLQAIGENLSRLIEETGAGCLGYQLPDEFRLRQHLSSFDWPTGMDIVTYSSEHFLVEDNEIASYFPVGKPPLMEFFYRKMRKRFNILMEEHGMEPLGGKWNFDHLNRNKLPDKVEIPHRKVFYNHVAPIVEMIKASEVETLGTVSDNQIVWPIDRAQSMAYLDDFLENGLSQFGTYQDALTDRDPFLFHSRLSFSLNTKILSPLEVVGKTIAYWQHHKESIDIAQVEGFIRQIIGWREYVRGVYWSNMPDYAHLNELEHKMPLPEMYWTGKTKMNCMKVAIGQSLEFAYAHHIQRLMITGNFALLLGVDPAEVDAWYLGIYIDALEWVEMPNTRGMSQYADGGMVGTKPYISSANYIHKMGDHCKKCYFDHKARIGPKACPFNSLYWEFYIRHDRLFRNNPRVGMAYRHIDKMSPEDQEAILLQAEYIRDHMDQY